MKKENLLNFVYVYKLDNFEGSMGLKNFSFSIDNLSRNIINNKLSEEVKITIVEWNYDQSNSIINNLYIKDKYKKIIDYIPITKKLSKNNNFNSCTSMNVAINRINSKFFLNCPSRTFISEACFKNLIDFIKNHKKSFFHKNKFYTINRLFLDYEIKNKKDHSYLNYYINNFEKYLKPNFYYPGLVSGFGGLLCETKILKKAKGFDERFWWGMNDIELGYRLSKYNEIINLTSKNIFFFDINKRSNANRSLDNLNFLKKKKDESWGLKNKIIKIKKVNNLTSLKFDKIYSHLSNIKFDYKSFKTFCFKNILKYDNVFEYDHFIVLLLNFIVKINLSFFSINSANNLNLIYSSCLVNKFSTNFFYCNNLSISKNFISSSVTISNNGFNGNIKFKNKKLIIKEISSNYFDICNFYYIEEDIKLLNSLAHKSKNNLNTIIVFKGNLPKIKSREYHCLSKKKNIYTKFPKNILKIISDNKFKLDSLFYTLKFINNLKFIKRKFYNKLF